MHTRRPAFALAVILWISAILMTVSIFLLAYFRQGVDDAKALHDKLVTRLQVDSTLAETTYLLLTRSLGLNAFNPDFKGWPPTVTFGRPIRLENDANLTIIPAGGDYLDLYTGNGQLVQRLVRGFTHDFVDYADPYDDWIDLDKTPRLGGAEAGFYSTLGVAYRPNDSGAIQHPEELFLIKGFRQVSLPLRPKIVARFRYSLSVGLNIAAMSPKFAKIFLDLPAFELIRLKMLLKKEYKAYVDALYDYVRRYYPNDETFQFSPPKHLIVRIDARKGPARTAVDAEIDLMGNDRRPCRVVHYVLTPSEIGYNISSKPKTDRPKP